MYLSLVDKNVKTVEGTPSKKYQHPIWMPSLKPKPRTTHCCTISRFMWTFHKITTLNIIFSVNIFNCLVHLRIVNCGTLSPTLTSLVIPCNFFWRIITLQRCKYYHFPSDFSSNFQSPTTIFHHKLLTREGNIWPMDELIHHPWQYVFTS